jgi:hypothetical protein
MAPTMKILAALALATYASAIPMAVDNAAPANDKRQAAPGTATGTVTETVWTTVDVTTTIYVDEPSPAASANNSAPPAAPAAATTPAVEVAAAASPTAAPVEPAAAPVAAAPVADNSPAAFAAAASPSPSPSTEAAVAPLQPAYTPVVAAAAAPASSSAVPAAAEPQAASSGSSSSGGPCEGPSSGCSGDVTHWDGGLGACGWNVNTASDMQIALPHELMGTQSNGNPYCGRSLTIKKPSGGTVQATVGDKCMGCEGDSIDLTNALFQAVVPGGDGRVSGVEWYFN